MRRARYIWYIRRKRFASLECNIINNIDADDLMSARTRKCDSIRVPIRKRRRNSSSAYVATPREIRYVNQLICSNWIRVPDLASSLRESYRNNMFSRDDVPSTIANGISKFDGANNDVLVSREINSIVKVYILKLYPLYQLFSISQLKCLFISRLLLRIRIRRHFLFFSQHSIIFHPEKHFRHAVDARIHRVIIAWKYANWRCKKMSEWKRAGKFDPLLSRSKYRIINFPISRAHGLSSSSYPKESARVHARPTRFSARLVLFRAEKCICVFARTDWSIARNERKLYFRP